MMPAADGDAPLPSHYETAVFSVLLCVGLAILIRRRLNWSNIIKRSNWLVALFIYMGLSVVWSNFPEETAIRWVRAVGSFVMVLIVLTEENSLDAITAVVRRCYYIHIPISLISVKYFRDFAVHYTWDGAKEGWAGLTSHKNSMGQVAMCSGLFFAWGMMKTRGVKMLRDLGLLLMSLYLLKGSSTWISGTSVLGLGIGVCILFGLQYVKGFTKKLLRRPFVLLLILAVSAGLVSFSMGASEGEVVPSMPIEIMGRDASLTGRTGLWIDIVSIASKSPIFGVGYGAFWVGPKGYDLYPLPNWSMVTPRWRPKQGHNGYVDLYVELGLAGVILIVGVIATAFRNIGQLLDSDFEYGKLSLTFLVVILLNNVTESSLIKGTHSLWFLFLLFAINLPSRSQFNSFEAESSVRK
jgi:O-antigen ligase